jgi:hypothetical protein
LVFIVIHNNFKKNKVMPNPNLREIEIVGKYSGEAYEIARSVIAELEADTSLPIREVMEIMATGTGAVEELKDPRLHYG